METKTGTTQEFNRFPFARDLHEIQPVFPEEDFGLGITSGHIGRGNSARVPLDIAGSYRIACLPDPTFLQVQCWQS
jgi:hypothetical protein